jgi:chromosome segregation ATPase
LKKVTAEKDASIRAMRQENEEVLARMRMEYEESAAAWDRKIREMADTLEGQRSLCNSQELELYALKMELNTKRAEINALEADCLGLEAQVNVSRAAVDGLEAGRREQSLRIKELEYEVEYTEDQYAQENRIVRIRDARIRDLEQGLVDAACVHSSLNTTLLYLQGRVAELEVQVEDLTERLAQGRAAEEKLRREFMASSDRHESELKAMEERNTEALRQLHEARYSIKELKDTVAEREAALSAQQTAIAAADRSIATLQAQITDDKDMYETLQAHLHEIHGKQPSSCVSEQYGPCRYMHTI